MDRNDILEKNKQSPPTDEMSKITADRSYMVAVLVAAVGLFAVLTYSILKGLIWQGIGSISFLFLGVQSLYVFKKLNRKPYALIFGVLCIIVFFILLFDFIMKTW